MSYRANVPIVLMLSLIFEKLNVAEDKLGLVSRKEEELSMQFIGNWIRGSVRACVHECASVCVRACVHERGWGKYK